MGALARVGSRLLIIGDLFAFLWRRRLWWMIVLVAVLLVFAGLFVLAQSVPFAPFIYTLF